MEYTIKEFVREDLAQATRIWNEIIEEGDSFPGDEALTEAQAYEMFMEQTATVCIMDRAAVAGLYILHPNNFGRCAHIANASYAVTKAYRGKGLGKTLVLDSIERAKACGFLGLQFNAVVASNYGAITLYLKLGFQIIGMVKNGFRKKDGAFSDTIIFLKSW